MYMDYQDSTPRTHDNLYNNIWKDIGLTVGSGLVGWGARSAGSSIKKKGSELKNEGMDILDKNPGQEAGKMGPENPKRQEGRDKVSRGIQKRVTGRSLAGFGRKLTSISNIFGWSTMALMGAKMAGSALRSGQAFRTTKEEVAKANYSSMYDQDTYYDTRAAYTQRQRALQVIHNSRLSLKPMLGAESNYLHY